MIKISNFSKFAEYITDSVRPVKQNSRHWVRIKHFIFILIYIMPFPIPSMCYYLSFLKFWPIYFDLKFYIWRKKSIARDWIGHVTCMAHGLKGKKLSRDKIMPHVSKTWLLENFIYWVYCLIFNIIIGPLKDWRTNIYLKLDQGW